MLTVAALMAVMMVANAATASARSLILDEGAEEYPYPSGPFIADDVSPSDVFVSDGVVVEESTPQNKAAERRGFYVI